MPVHPWNKEFTWQTPPGPYRRITDAQARQWDDDGYFLLEDALDPDALARVTEAIDPFEERSTEWLREQGGTMFIADADAITFTTHLVTRSPVVREFAASDAFADLNHDLIGPDTRLYWDQAVYKKPESPKEFPWHQDNGYTFVEPQQYLTCWVPLVDATVDNGCPWVAPGKHREGTLEHWLTPVGFQCLEDPADAAPHRAQRQHRHAQGLHPPVRARRCHRVEGRRPGPAGGTAPPGRSRSTVRRPARRSTGIIQP
jgi:phytanoyl-CoA hydroxylase